MHQAKRFEVHPEAMLEPRTVRRLAWVLPDDAAAEQVLEVLQASGARQWQIELLAGDLVRALRAE